MLKLMPLAKAWKELDLDAMFERDYLQFMPWIAGGSVTVSPQSNPVASKLVVDLDSDATAENNVTGTTGSFYMVDVDNTANAAATYLKIYDAAAPTVGTTAPDWIFKVPASVRRTFVCPDGAAFATALSFASLTAGGTAGVTGPTSDVIVRIVTS